MNPLVIEQQLAAIVQSSDDAILSVDRGGTVVSWNPGASRMFGYSEAEMVGEPVDKLIPPDRRDERDRISARVFAGEESGQLVTQRLHRDGTLVDVSLTGSPIRDSAGEIVGASAIIRDITDWLRSQEELERSQAQLVHAQRVAHMGSWELSISDGRVSCSQELLRIFGTEQGEAELTAEDFLTLVHPADREQVEGKLAGVLAGHTEKFEDVSRLVRPDGDVRVLRARAQLIRDADGRPRRLIGASHDVTDQERASEETAHLAGLNRLILDSVGDGVYGIDTEGRVTFVNPAAAAMLGYEPRELVGKGLHYLIHHTGLDGEPVPASRCEIYGAVWDGVAVRSGHDLFWPKEGEALHVEWVSSPLFLEGETAGAVVSFKDIGERVREEAMRRELRERTAQAERLESVGKLAGGVAHDFNNLLAIILNYAAFVGEQLHDRPDLQGEVDEIRRAAERAAALTSRLLTFSRREPVKLEALDLNAVLAGMKQLLRKALGEHIHLDTRHAPDLWPVEADASQIEQVLLNLAVNARDAMPDGGTLSIATANVELSDEHASVRPGLSASRHVQLRVADTGRGMSPELAARAFEPFFTTKGEGGGTGLGLAAVYGAVTQAHGHVDLESDPGRGTAFTIHIPAGTRPPLAPAPAPAVEPAAVGTVLVVEDEDAVRSLTQRILERQGYRVLAAPDGLSALDMVTRHRGQLDLMVTDVLMAEMSGRQLAESVRALRPALPILYTSGHAYEALAEEGVLPESNGFLQKPFDADGLLASVRRSMQSTST